MFKSEVAECAHMILIETLTSLREFELNTKRTYSSDDICNEYSCDIENRLGGMATNDVGKVVALSSVIITRIGIRF